MNVGETGCLKVKSIVFGNVH